MIALLGSKGATADGTSMLVHNNDGDFIDETWRYTYIAAPTNGNAFWSSTTPGKFFDIMGANNQGLAMALTVGGNKTWIPARTSMSGPSASPSSTSSSKPFPRRKAFPKPLSW